MHFSRNDKNSEKVKIFQKMIKTMGKKNDKNHGGEKKHVFPKMVETMVNNGKNHYTLNTC